MKLWPFGRKDKAKKSQRGYAGAMFNRLVSDWVASGTSMDSEIRASLKALRDRSRQLARDNDYCRNAFRLIRNNVVGQGIGFQAQVRNQRGGKLNDFVNAQIESAWEKWCRKENCHAGGTLHFSDIERLITGSVAESGEVIIRFIYQAMGTTKVPLALEIIEADLLDETYNGRTDSGNEIRMGVEINQWSRPVAYWFLNKHPGDYQYNPQAGQGAAFQRRRIPADEICHLFIMDRVGQTRGIPWLASAIMRLHHMHGYEQAEVIAARATASIMGFIESPEGEAPADGVEAGEKVTDFQPGIFKYLGPGEKVNVPPLARPGGQFDPFMRAMLRGVGSGIGVSYESLSKDYSQSNYSSSRLALLDDRDNWRVLQKWIIENFHQRVLEKWLDMAVLSGELSLKGYETNPEIYTSVRWMPRGWSWIDPAKEVLAYKEAVRSGFKTVSDVVAESGGDIEELMQTRKRELEMSDDMGIVLDTDPRYVSLNGITQAKPPGSAIAADSVAVADEASTKPAAKPAPKK